jgi:hypothetical protein
MRFSERLPAIRRCPSVQSAKKTQQNFNAKQQISNKPSGQTKDIKIAQQQTHYVSES